MGLGAGGSPDKILLLVLEEKFTVETANILHSLTENRKCVMEVTGPFQWQVFASGKVVNALVSSVKENSSLKCDLSISVFTVIFSLSLYVRVSQLE